MNYTPTVFVDNSPPAISAEELNKIGNAIAVLAPGVIEVAAFDAESSSSTNYVVSTAQNTTPSQDELPLSMSFIPTVSNGINCVVTPTWGSASYGIYDYDSAGPIPVGAIRANQPIDLMFDGVRFWMMNGKTREDYYLQYRATATDGYWLQSASTPTSTTPITYNGYIHATRFYGAVWNDYAEYRCCKEILKAGTVVVETGDGSVTRSTKRLQSGGSIVSDTYGMSIGQSSKDDLPVAVSGRVLAFCDKDRNSFKVGDPVCTGPYGTVSRMSRVECVLFPDRIIGYVSCVPRTNSSWVNESINVGARIWIKLK